MAKCIICKKESVETYRPFCSPRCKAVDLNRWLSGSYALPSEEPVSEDAMTEEPLHEPLVKH